MISRGVPVADILEFMAEEVHRPGYLTLGETIGEGPMPVVLPAELRNKHVYVIGKSGHGKTNLLRNLILQDLESGSGMAVLAPELELLTEEILPFIPDERIGDVIFFNPNDFDSPVVFNPLHLFPGDDLDLQVDEIYTILQRVFGEGGSRMDEILRNAIHALIERPGSTLLDVGKLLDPNDAKFRNDIVWKTEDEYTKNYFSKVYPSLHPDSHLPILNRMGKILRSKYVRNCLCPPKQTSLSEHEASKRLLDVRASMDGNKILLFNLSDGLIGTAASQLIGQLIVSKFQTAIMSRADTAKANRVPFYLYLDEFQNFCGSAEQSYSKILERSRKYGMGIILAHQQSHQISSDLLHEILGCVATRIAFQISHADATRLAHDLCSGPPSEVSAHLTTLGIGKAACRIGPSEFTIVVPKAPDTGRPGRANEVIERSKATYGIPRVLSSAGPKTQGALNPEDDPLADFDPEDTF